MNKATFKSSPHKSSPLPPPDILRCCDVFVEVPIGTYTGWNLFNRSFFEDGFCTLQGSFIPFAPTRAERLATGDSRLSIEERYPLKEAYAAAVKQAAERLVSNRHLLPE